MSSYDQSHKQQKDLRRSRQTNIRPVSSSSSAASVMLCIVLAVLATLLPKNDALQLFPRKPTAASQLHVHPLDTPTEDLSLTPGSEGDDVSEWSAVSSWGATLLQRRKEEEEIMRGISDKDESAADVDVADLSVIDDEEDFGPPEEEDIPEDIAAEGLSPPEARELTEMDVQTAKELDKSVTIVSPRDFKEDMTVLPMSPYYTSQLTQNSGQVSDMPLSRPEHYSDRIDRDKRLLAIGIAESVDEAWQWRRFEEEKGGIKSLLSTIQNGAKFVSMQRSSDLSSNSINMMDEYEETFMAACSACRALRDLCTISDDVRAVMTDEILRANAATGGGANGLIKDFCTLLRHADEAEVLHSRLYNFRPKSNLFRLMGRKDRRESRRRCKLYVLQMLLAMAIASDDAIDTFRATPELKEVVLGVSSYAFTQRTRRWLRYPGELWKFTRRKSKAKSRPFIEAASISEGLTGQVQGTANQLLAAIGCNQWVPKIPGQKGLRILCFDGGGTRGMSAISSLRGLTEAMGGAEVCDTFDIIAGTSTGAIIAFLVGLRRETSQKANDRYDVLVEKIFGKSTFKLSTIFTTATYSELPFVEVLNDILGDNIMLDSRADPAVPLVFAVSSVMTSTPTYVTLFRNYNYEGGELPDHFVDDPDDARRKLGLRSEFENRAPKSEWRTNLDLSTFVTGTKLTKEGSRYYGSFRPLQREALRKSTAAPTIFKPVKVKDALYCDGGIVASNPTAIAIHEAKTLFPDVPIELVVSIGTGGFTEERFSPKFGWDAIIGQIVNSACDGERIHHILEDLSGHGNNKGMKYYRFNPVIGGAEDFPIDSKDPELLAQLYGLTTDYLEEPEQQKKLKEIRNILDGKRGWRKLVPW